MRYNNGKKTTPADAGAGPEMQDAVGGPSTSYVLHRQQAMKKDAVEIFDLKKKKLHKKANKVDDLGIEINLDNDAKSILHNTARTFIEMCFNGACLFIKA